MKTSLIQTKYHRILHNLIDASNSWVFLVKAFDLGNEKSISTVILFVLGLALIPIVGMDGIIVDLTLFSRDFCHTHRRSF